MRRWILITTACLAAAVQQWVELVGRLKQLVTFAWKFGVEERVFNEPVFMVVVFFVATALFVVLGLVAADRLRRLESPVRFCAQLAVQALLAGALVWTSMLASSFVEIVKSR